MLPEGLPSDEHAAGQWGLEADPPLSSWKHNGNCSVRMIHKLQNDKVAETAIWGMTIHAILVTLI